MAVNRDAKGLYAFGYVWSMRFRPRLFGDPMRPVAEFGVKRHSWDHAAARDAGVLVPPAPA